MAVDPELLEILVCPKSKGDLELAYRLPGEARLGLCVYHLSNGGIYHLNPGSESLVLTYSARLRK